MAAPLTFLAKEMRRFGLLGGACPDSVGVTEAASAEEASLRGESEATNP
jgi:hypothetical protein